MKGDSVHRVSGNMAFRLFVCILFSSLLAGCENSFEPIKDNNLYNYSMYGILDLTADTHWVRVMPLRNTIFRDSMGNDATVRLIRESTGQTEQLEDTLLRLAQNTYVWNFWTTTQLQPSEDYTVTAESPEGEITFATASIPADFPPPEIYYRENTENCHIIIDSIVERLVVAEITYEFQIEHNDETTSVIRFPISHIRSVQDALGGDHELVINNDIATLAAEHNVSPSQIINLSGELLLVSADSNWTELDMTGADLPGENSNVQNGLGIVTGIVSKTFPLRPTWEDQQHYSICPPREQ